MSDSTIKSKLNIYISSKYRQQDETVSNFKCVIPDGLLKCKTDEHFSLNVSAFYMYNTFFNCNSNYNHFQLIFTNSLGYDYMLGDYYFNVGNPNINDLMIDFNTQLNYYCSVSYNRITNRYTYTRVYNQNSNYFNMYLIPINAAAFLGFVNHTRNLISFSGTTSTNAINVNPIKAINITIGGDITFEDNNIDNCYSVWQNSDIILQKAVDVPTNGLIKYENVDGGDSFQYFLYNTDRIKYFQLNVYDQDMNVISDLPDFLLQVQFNIRQTPKTNDILTHILEYIKDIFNILGHLLEYFTKNI